MIIIFKKVDFDKIFFLLLILLITGCGGSGSSGNSEEPVSPESPESPITDTLAPTVTVSTQTTNDTSPSLSGTIDGTGSNIISVEVNLSGNSYSASINGITWSIASNIISPPLAAGTYDIAITATDGANNIGYDTTNNELLIITSTPVVVPQLASRIIGVAPLAVFFDAVGTPGVMQPPDVGGHREFADLHYQWNFGDGSAGLWTTSGKSKNSGTGYVNAHVYEIPGTYLVNLVITAQDGLVANYQLEIEVQNPDVIFTGVSTTCISTGVDFTGCPSGAQEVTTSVFSDISNYIAAGQRILLRRGDVWSTADSIQLGTAGPLVIGAFGECLTPNQLGICGNAPSINAFSTNAYSIFDTGNTNDTRLMDLNLINLDSREAAISGSSIEMNQILFLHLMIKDFSFVALGNGATGVDDDQIMVVESDISNSEINNVYIGSKRLVLMGNHLTDPNVSHVLRVWHAHKAYIAHNEISGASAQSNLGRHALKLHGPMEEELGVALDTRTRYVVISDNLFGSSGPSPVAIAPQYSGAYERLEDIVVEKNRFFAGYGTLSALAQGGLTVSARYVTVRNNIFDGEGSEKYFIAISVNQRGTEPVPLGNRIYNNTFHKIDDIAGYKEYAAVWVGASAQATIVRNNLAQFNQLESSIRALIWGGNTDVIQSHNLLTEDAGLIDPVNPDHLQKNFGLTETSPALEQGTKVPVFEDFIGNMRPLGGSYDLGAFEMIQ